MNYDAVNTKISALYGKLLQDDDYKKMISLKTPTDIAVYLKDNTHYREFFRDKDVSKMHRDEIERLLKEGLITYMDKLIHYFYGAYRDFFKCFYLKYEIIDLKTIARQIHIEKDFANLSENLVFAGKYRYIDINKVLKAHTIPELINSLEGTVYYPYIKNIMSLSSNLLYNFEMSIDKAYFSILEEKVGKLAANDKKAFYDLYGSYIDMLNLQWIYRGKKFYKLSPEEIFNYTLNKGYKFNYQRIKIFCYSNDIEDFIKKATQTPYAFLFKNDETQDIFMERRMHRYLYNKVKNAKRRAAQDISPVISYMELIEFQLNDIVSIIENVRYGMNLEETKKYLIKAI